MANKDLTVHEFFKRFPDDDTCLNHLFAMRYGKEIECPKCNKISHFSRIKKMPAFACQWCGHHIHPMAGTPFHRSRTPLQKWFYAIYMFTTSRHGVAAKELQRQLGVTYKCAWRMAHEIRKYMGKVDGDDNLSGHVEIDETYIGGYRPEKRGRFANKSKVFGMVERKGNIMTRIVPNLTEYTLGTIINEKIDKGTTISSDEWKAYQDLQYNGYEHGTVKHGVKQYVNGIHHTNSIEGFWSILKRSIKGTHVHVSKKHLAKYLGEFEFRYNMRANPSLMFDRLILAF
jgi:transposase-like protein